MYLNRPKKFNGLSLPMFRAIEKTALDLKKNKEVRAVVLAGRGRVFCAGLDVNSMMSFQFSDNIKALLNRESGRVDNLAQSVGYLWRDLDVPVIAAVHGVCFGGGFQIAMGADVRVAAPNTRFSIMEAKWGLIPDMSGSVTLREIVPMSVAKRLTWSGEMFDTEIALNHGIVSDVSKGDPVEHAVSYAESLSISSSDEALRVKRDMLRNREDRFRDPDADRVDTTAFDVTLPAVSMKQNHHHNECKNLQIKNNIAQLEIEQGNYVNISAACDQIAQDRNIRALILHFSSSCNDDDDDDDSSVVVNSDAVSAANDLRQLAIPVLGVIQGKEHSISNLAICLGGVDVRFGSSELIFPKHMMFNSSSDDERSIRMRAFEESHMGNVVQSENPTEEALGFASTICEKSPDAVAFGKELFQNTWHCDERAALLEETRLQEQIIPSWNMMRCAAINLLPNWISGMTSFKSRQVARL